MKVACEASKAVCTSLVKEKKTAAPPKLFDLTSLQREANRIFGYTAKQTLDLAQALYEKKLLTYPRTDSSYLTDDMGDTATDIIKLLCGKFSFMEGADFTPELAKVLNSKKVSDHHAIIPTMEIAKTDIIALPESEKNILTLAGTRLLMATAALHTFVLPQAAAKRILRAEARTHFPVGGHPTGPIDNNLITAAGYTGYPRKDLVWCASQRWGHAIPDLLRR